MYVFLRFLQTVTLLVGRDKLEVAAASLKIRYNEIDVVVSEDQPLEVHHADHTYQSSSRPSIGVYKVDIIWLNSMYVNDFA